MAYAGVGVDIVVVAPVGVVGGGGGGGIVVVAPVGTLSYYLLFLDI